MKLFITGSTGFIGQNLIKQLDSRNVKYTAGTRLMYGDFSTDIEWSEVLKNSDAIVHLANRAHVMNETSLDPLSEFRKINVQGTINLAKAAKIIGIKKFIYLSSIKVNGEESGNSPFTSDDKPNPLDPYGISKMEAEIELMSLHEKDVFEVTIIRPPLVYGPGVKANFEKLFWLVQKDLPLPFGKVNNKRSLVSVLNLCDLIIECAFNANAGGRIFLVSDDKDYSLKELIELAGKVLGKHPHLLPIPVELMKCVLGFLGKASYADRLFGNLHVDINQTKKILNWNPPYCFEDTYKN